MIATTNYEDLLGTSSADLSDYGQNDLITIASDLGIDTKKYKPVGLHIASLKLDYIEFLCEDLSKSTQDKKYMVKIYVDNEEDGLIQSILKRVDIVLFLKFVDEAYKSITDYKSINLSEIQE